jgi:hypothetical protein
MVIKQAFLTSCPRNEHPEPALPSLGSNILDSGFRGNDGMRNRSLYLAVFANYSTQFDTCPST